MSDAETIRCPAHRRGRTWVASVHERGAYGHGRTLQLTAANITQALALLGVTAEVTLVPVTPELEQLRAAEDRYTAALRQTVVALALRRVSARDIATATGVPAKRVRELLEEAEAAPHSTASDLDPAGGEHAAPAAPPEQPGPSAPRAPGSSAASRSARRAAGVHRARSSRGPGAAADG
jgi:hypothetical protein